jgi:hypothetical protein
VSTSEAGGWQLVIPPDIPLPTVATRRPGVLPALVRTVAWQARWARIPPLDQGTVICVLRMPGTTRFDVADWTPTGEAVADGLLDAGIFTGYTAMRGPELRGASGLRGKAAQLTVRIYPAGQPAPPPAGKHTEGRRLDYDAINGDQLHYTTVAAKLGVDPRTVLRWRARWNGITVRAGGQ